MATTKLKVEATAQSEVADIIGHLAEMGGGNGKFLIAVGRKFQELVDAIVDVGTKKGTMTITLEVEPAHFEAGRVSQVNIYPDVKIKPPQHDQPQTLFFVTERGHKLTRDNPEQMGMEFQDGEPYQEGIRH